MARQRMSRLDFVRVNKVSLFFSCIVHCPGPAQFGNILSAPSHSLHTFITQDQLVDCPAFTWQRTMTLPCADDLDVYRFFYNVDI